MRRRRARRPERVAQPVRDGRPARHHRREREHPAARFARGLESGAPDARSGETPVTGRPLVSLAFALNYAAGGLDPFGYHLANFVIHLLCAALVFASVRATAARVIADRPDALSIPALPFAFACAALWAVYPLHTEGARGVRDALQRQPALYSGLAATWLVLAAMLLTRPVLAGGSSSSPVGRQG